MAGKRIRQIDVAERAGVSTTAVSLVLNNRAGTRLSEEAAARIRAAAADLGYRPNLTARALSTQRSQIIGFISDRVTTGRFGNDLIRGALEEAKRHDHVLFIAETDGEPGAAADAVQALVDRQVDGIVFAATRPERLQVPAHPESTPVVMLNAVADEHTPVVLADEYTGARKVVEALLGAGHRQEVAVLGRRFDQRADAMNNVGLRRRLDGVWDALAAHGVEPVAEVFCEPWTVEAGREATRELLAQGVRPRALICLNDQLSFGAYRELERAGLRVPEDVSVVSFDDDDIAVYLEPQLTTVAFPYRDMGALAVRLLLQEEPPGGQHLVPMPIRWRDSVQGLAISD